MPPPSHHCRAFQPKKLSFLYLHQIKQFLDEKDKKRADQEEADRLRLEAIKKALAEQAVFDKERYSCFVF